MADTGESSQQRSDPVTPDEGKGPHGIFSKTEDNKFSRPDGPPEQIFSYKDEIAKSSSVQLSDSPGELTVLAGSLDAPQMNLYPMGHAICHGGYESPRALWNEYSQTFYSRGIELGPHATHPFIFHSGYGFTHHMPYGPYSPAGSFPLERSDSPMYSSQDLHRTAPYFRLQGPTAIARLASSSSSSASQMSSVGHGQYYHDMWHSIDQGFWSEGMRPLTLLSPAASPQAFSVGPAGHGISSFSFPVGSPWWNQYDRGTQHQGTENSHLCNCYGPAEMLDEQNQDLRGAVKQRVPSQKRVVSIDCGPHDEPDFNADYDDARFFVIKSYSEDNVHKSIKYGVWASTSNGNSKLDSAYRESKSKGTQCPVFLLFSVNAGAHFCGVAEMVGPVDFEKSVDFWQQDKWSGHFPVKWHIIKDVPNSFFRHIILENNDNKPITNSRDTQEVNLKQGVEMLNIFKDHESLISILNDFDFYEDRERAMKERKAKQRQWQGQKAANSELPVGQICGTFAQFVQLDEKKSEKKDELQVVGATVEPDGVCWV